MPLRLNKSSYKKGNATLFGLIAALGVALFTAVFSQLGSFRISLTQKRIQDSVNQLGNENIGNILTFMVREASLQYYTQLANLRIANPNSCPSANTFESALNSGNGCATGSSPFKLFSAQSPDAGVTNSLYSFTNSGCEIRQSASTCSAPDPIKIMDIGITNPVQASSDFTFEVYYLTSKPLIHTLEFIVIKSLKSNPQKKWKSLISIQTSSNSYAHLTGDGSIAVQNPNPMARCESTPWSILLKLSNNALCTPYERSGSVSGLASFDFNGARLFGLQSNDGEVVLIGDIDDYSESPKIKSQNTGESGQSLGLFSLNPGRTILPNGTNTLGEQVFVPYDPAVLLGAEDMEIVKGGETQYDVPGQLYFIRGSGPGASMYVYNPYGNNSSERVINVCNFAELGYPQSFHSLVALSWSEVLIFPGSPILSQSELVPRTRSASFLLFSSTGQTIFAAVIQPPPAATGGIDSQQAQPRCIMADLKQGERNPENGQLVSGLIELTRMLGGTNITKPKPYKIEKL